ncbi:MAG TPA: DUF255 domain-containing protein [Thermoflexales bacterium]|nr:DUF255 domain-containing protein [Thermoflexales bacterium]
MKTLVNWREWDESAFLDARAQGKPILMGISAVWCHWCHVMDRGEAGHPVHTGVYNNPEIAALINARFIPIRVDNDLRPDINARYNQGGWPTTCFLTPDGQVIYGGTYFSPGQMRSLLAQIEQYWRANGGKLMAEAPDLDVSEPAQAGALDAEQILSDTVNAIARGFDTKYGGLGDSQKFPMAEAWEALLLAHHQTDERKWLDMTVQTLIAMGTRGMYDNTAGGWFRYSTTPDWSVPHFEKMLEDHARLLPVYAHAIQLLRAQPDGAAQAETLAKVVTSAVGYLTETLLRDEAGFTWFAGSQDADEAYYLLSRDERAAREAPFIDWRLYAEWNALMVTALFTAAAVLDRPDWATLARRVLATLEQLCVNADGSVTRSIAFDAAGAPQPATLRGSLGDQSAVIRAMLEAGRAEAARPLIEFARRALAAEGGGFHDAPADPGALGLLKVRLRPIFENAAMAEALLRAAHLLPDAAGLAEEARAALALQAEGYKRYRDHAGPYALVAWRASREPEEYVVLGSPEQTAPFLRAASQRYHPWRILRALDPADPAALAVIEARAFPHARLPVAFVCLGTVCGAPVFEVGVV